MTIEKAVLYLRLCAALASGVGSVAFAQASARPSASHAMKLVKLPNGDYTIPLSELEASGTSGKVTLHSQGMRTLVTVYAYGKDKHKHAFRLTSGSDCVAASATSGVALKPALTGNPSQTLVSLPLTDLTSKNYLVDVQDARERRQFHEACAKL